MRTCIFFTCSELVNVTHNPRFVLRLHYVFMKDYYNYNQDVNCNCKTNLPKITKPWSQHCHTGEIGLII